MRQKLIVTTSWDDGQKADLRLAELLSKYGIKGTFYITESYRNPLGKQEVLEVAREHEIGAHTLSHVDLSKVTLSVAKTEIAGSKAYIEDVLGHAIKMIGYPYGRYNEAVKKIVRDCRFIGARTCDPGGFRLPQDPYQWHITLFASNASPLMAARIWAKFHLGQPIALLDWESRAKLLFDLALKRGGIYHIYGHSADFKSSKEWGKLERVLGYFSKREGVAYKTNGEILASPDMVKRSFDDG